MENKDKRVGLEDEDFDKGPKVMKIRALLRRAGDLQQRGDSIDFPVRGSHPSEKKVGDDKVVNLVLTEIGLLPKH